VPYDGIGGVETAARSMAGHSAGGIEFQVHYIFPPDKGQRRRYDTFNPWAMLLAARRIVADKPDFLIVSLWRSCLVALLAKLLSPRLQLVLFLHMPDDTHWLDYLATRCVAALACQVWADSQETLDRRLPAIEPAKGRVISFVSSRLPSLPGKPVHAEFIFWGRLHPQKRLDRALAIFSAVHAADKSARFIIIGPDGGERTRIAALVNTMGLVDAVQLLGGLAFSDIIQHANSASFYLQTSTLEGMAMSVVEAMQLGLVPVVTPVGEIAHYCRHGENAILVREDAAIVADIMALLRDDARYQMLRKNAVATWVEKPLYGESMLAACTAL
jgi:glycosyltransferase involved in cell wall biosynthesis